MPVVEKYINIFPTEKEKKLAIINFLKDMPIKFKLCFYFTDQTKEKTTALLDILKGYKNNQELAIHLDDLLYNELIKLLSLDRPNENKKIILKTITNLVKKLDVDYKTNENHKMTYKNV